MIHRRVVVLLCLSLCLGMPGLSAAVSVEEHPPLAEIVDRLVSEHGLDRDELVETFNNVSLRPEVVEAIRKPAERLPWHRYRSFFITPAQIEKGAQFWRENASPLARAEREMGVPQEIIVAIIGVETRYGATLGSHPVMESLTTLTLEYPRRRAFFSEQLEHFLLLAHEQGLDSLAVYGSYAGAMGIPQFMPTSYRQYAVDFNGDGKIDLLSQTEDAIGSVANYLKRFKWQAGQPVSVELESPGSLAPGLLDHDSRLPTTAAALRAAGVDVPAAARDDLKAGIVGLDGEDGTLYWAVFENFYVLTRYNTSKLYAMAVHELSTELKKASQGS